MKKFVSCLSALLLVAACSSALAGTPPGNLGNRGIAPPQSHPFGKSYAEWGAAWWQWTLAMPFDHNPLAETADCSTGQSGPVWFIGGSFVGAEAVRTCTVPVGKAIFFPVLNTECSTAEGPPFHGETEAELRDCAKGWVDGGTGFCTIDGVLVKNLEAYRVQSPLFGFGPLPDNNVCGVPAGSTGQSISDGYWLMLQPLSAGGHTIDFVGTFSQHVGGFSFHITYNLMVE